MEVFIPDNDSPAPDVVTIFRIAGWPGRGVCYGDRESVSKAPRPAATRGLREKTRRPGCKTISQGESLFLLREGGRAIRTDRDGDLARLQAGDDRGSHFVVVLHDIPARTVGEADRRGVGRLADLDLGGTRARLLDGRRRAVERVSGGHGESRDKRNQ
jgi:hypothetical protein